MMTALYLLCIVAVAVNGYTGAKMGQLTNCDDAKTNLEVDWDPHDYTQFTCANDLSYNVDSDIQPTTYEIHAVNASYDPRHDQVGHKCMSEAVEYKDTPPLRGDHRPNWARYGEYLYVPPQRWLHNLEHGSIILLYHPCANPEELNKLRQLVNGCLWRHVITPYNKLSEQRPFALVSWGVKIEMNYIDEATVVNFIKAHARQAPEDLSREGLYDQYLIYPSVRVNDEMDNNVCANLNHTDGQPFLDPPSATVSD